MKKNFRIGAVAMSVLLTGGTLTACGGGKIKGADDRPSILVSVFDGGYGRAWLEDIVNAYNDENPNNAYKIEVAPSKDIYSQVSAAIQAGTAEYDIFQANGKIYELINGGYLEPLTDVFDSKPEGSDKSIRNMLTVKDYVTAYSGRDGEMYAIPWQEGIKGFVYDHDLFVKYGLLYKEGGGFITSATDTLSKGKDGIAGTFDDGHPVTEAEWETMVAKADAAFGNAFSYTGEFAGYLNDLFVALMAQYDGMEQALIHYTFNGQYDIDGDGVRETEITPQNMVSLADAPGKRAALNFMDKYLANKKASMNIKTPYVNPLSEKQSYSASQAQKDYVRWSAQEKEEQIAMLYEGDWWENEAYGIFNALEGENYTDYKFKARNYKFMTLPNFEGQKTDTTHNVVPVGDNLFFAMKKQTNAEKESIGKDFMTYMYQPRWLQNYAVRCGGLTPYDVELTAEQTAQLSPFAKNIREIYYSPNTELIRDQVLLNMYDTCKSGYPVVTSNGEEYVVMYILYESNVDTYLSKMKTSYTNRNADLYKKYLEYIGD